MNRVNFVCTGLNQLKWKMRLTELDVYCSSACEQLGCVLLRFEWTWIFMCSVEKDVNLRVDRINNVPWANQMTTSSLIISDGLNPMCIH